MTSLTWTIPLAQLNNQWLWLGLVLVLIFLVLYVPRMRRRNKSRGESVSFDRQSRRTADRIQLSLEKLMVELFDMSRDINAQLDTRMAALQHLLREADDKIRQLKEAGADSARQEQPRPTPPEEPQQPAPDAPADETPNDDSAPGETDDRPADKTPLLKTGTAADPEHREIYRLADEGRTSTEIARQTGRPIGEVQLILDLRKAGGG